jgi:hypothetical protein
VTAVIAPSREKHEIELRGRPLDRLDGYFCRRQLERAKRRATSIVPQSPRRAAIRGWTHSSWHRIRLVGESTGFLSELGTFGRTAMHSRFWRSAQIGKCLVNVVTLQVDSAQNHMAGYATQSGVNSFHAKHARLHGLILELEF